METENLATIESFDFAEVELIYCDQNAVVSVSDPQLSVFGNCNNLLAYYFVWAGNYNLVNVKV